MSEKMSDAEKRARTVPPSVPEDQRQEVVAQATSRIENVEGDCGACWHCHDENGRGFPIMFLCLCPDCGDERCARALDHREECDNARALTEEDNV